MACFHPLDAAASISAETGKRVLRFRKRGQPWPGGERLKLPCGQCIGCRLDRSLQWAVRCMHEAFQHEENCFITLTYDDEHIPLDGSLCKPHFQKFMKRLRRRYPDRTTRYFHCGEYGDRLGRPHYHACIFGFDFPDKVLLRDDGATKLFTSEILASLWTPKNGNKPYGFSTVGAVTFESAAYVARYCTKKITGGKAFEHYISPDGVQLQPEYSTMSRRPGIGRDWYDSYKADVFPWDEIIQDGRPVKPPRYYESRYQIEDPEAHARLKAKRLETAQRLANDNTPERLKARERVKQAQFNMLSRSLEK